MSATASPPGSRNTIFGGGGGTDGEADDDGEAEADWLAEGLTL
jgi:hypothetical protein